MSGDNDLNELNSILFDTLRGVSKGNVDPKQANAVIGLSNALVNNAKVQLQAMKLAGKKNPTKFLGLAAGNEKPTDRHEAMTMFAKEKGYSNASEALVEMTKAVFESEFKKWWADEN